VNIPVAKREGSESELRALPGHERQKWSQTPLIALRKELGMSDQNERQLLLPGSVTFATSPPNGFDQLLASALVEISLPGMSACEIRNSAKEFQPG
jgi:hypothetical protein